MTRLIKREKSQINGSYLTSFFNQTEMFRNQNQLHNLFCSINNISVVTFGIILTIISIIINYSLNFNLFTAKATEREGEREGGFTIMFFISIFF